MLSSWVCVIHEQGIKYGIIGEIALITVVTVGFIMVSEFVSAGVSQRRLDLGCIPCIFSSFTSMQTNHTVSKVIAFSNSNPILPC
jgi:hypothetical protein